MTCRVELSDLVFAYHGQRLTETNEELIFLEQELVASAGV